LGRVTEGPAVTPAPFRFALGQEIKAALMALEFVCSRACVPPRGGLEKRELAAAGWRECHIFEQFSAIAGRDPETIPAREYWDPHSGTKRPNRQDRSSTMIRQKDKEPPSPRKPAPKPPAPAPDGWKFSDWAAI
jgi:hypothetical protein